MSETLNHAWPLRMECPEKACMISMIDGGQCWAMDSTRWSEVSAHISKWKVLRWTGRMNLVRRMASDPGQWEEKPNCEYVITRIQCTPEQAREFWPMKHPKQPCLRLKPRRFPWQRRFRTEQVWL